MDSPIMMLITAFIGVSIMLAIAVSILSGVQGGFDCKDMQGYVSNATTTATMYPSGTWSGTCWEVQQQTQQSLTLLIVILVVIAAVAILVVVRML